MLLHDAITNVLEQNARLMSTREIANVINRQGLYSRGDGNPVPASQISARIGNPGYAHLFNKSGGRIGLNN